MIDPAVPLLSVRTRAVLQAAGIASVLDLRGAPRDAVKALPKVTPAILAELAAIPGLEHLSGGKRARKRGGGGLGLDRARGPVAGDDPQTALFRRLEFFPSPPWSGRAGGELIARVDPGRWTCAEVACGQGHLAHGLADYFASVRCSDLHAYGAGAVADFLDVDAAFEPVDWIVTNPPFEQAAQFVNLGLRRARRGVAILQRLTFLESLDRFPLFFGSRPLTVFAPFTERVPMQLGGWDPEGSTATPYAWFVWLQPGLWAGSADGRVRACAAQGGAAVIPIPPGSRRRLSRASDLRFARAA